MVREEMRRVLAAMVLTAGLVSWLGLLLQLLQGGP